MDKSNHKPPSPPAPGPPAPPLRALCAVLVGCSVNEQYGSGRFLADLGCTLIRQDCLTY